MCVHELEIWEWEKHIRNDDTSSCIREEEARVNRLRWFGQGIMFTKKGFVSRISTQQRQRQAEKEEEERELILDVETISLAQDRTK